MLNKGTNKTYSKNVLKLRNKSDLLRTVTTAVVRGEIPTEVLALNQQRAAVVNFIFTQVKRHLT